MEMKSEFVYYLLLGSLQHHEVEQDFEFAFSSLAVCSSGTHVRKRQIRRLLDIALAARDHNVGKMKLSLLIVTLL
jgi:gastric intrinsic factor